MSTNNSEVNISIDDDAELLALEKLLTNPDEEEPKIVETVTSKLNSENSVPRLREDSTFADAFSYDINLPEAKLKEANKIGITEELDSSDDEEVKNFLERKYNEYGSDINKKLKQQLLTQFESKVDREINSALKNNNSSNVESNSLSTSVHIKNPHNPTKRNSLISNSFTKPAASQTAVIQAPTTPVRATFTDPVFGLRIINPLISSSLLLERMKGRTPVPFSALALHIQRGDLSKDWVMAGALVNKSPVRMSKKGDPFSIWRMSDLRGEIKMASIFLFKGAHKNLWKTAEGMCIAVLNPNIFEKRAENGEVACFSIDNAQKVMVLGQSKDFGTCRSRKKNGDPCTAVVNLTECDYCIFHMKQEFGKMSRRSELQSATTGRGLNDLRNKVLGKSEVFYGGQSYTAVPAKKSAKLVAKDVSRISALSEYAVSPFASAVNHASKSKDVEINIPYAARDGPISKIAANVDVGRKQRLKDLERLKILQSESIVFDEQNSDKLQSHESPIVPSVSGITVVPEKFKNREFSLASSSPQLSRDNFSIEINVGQKRAQAAKNKAATILKQKPIKKVNPNSIRGSTEGKRRAIDELNEKFQTHGAKRQKMEEEEREAARKSRIQRIMDASSSHTNLVDFREQQEQDKYFSVLEKKEALEEKMLNTFKMPCKAVICQLCKYTAFSAAESCKQEKHPLKVVDAVKRFFKCKDCGNRTATVFKLPKISCSNCKSSRWERTAMIRERKIVDGSEGLSIRGNEETFLGSLAGKANLNLLVPDE